MNEQELLADCLRRLNRSGVTYYLTGSMAGNYWGIPRTTHDLDFVIQLPASAVEKSSPPSRRIFTLKRLPCAPRISRRTSSTPLTRAPR
jgi:hypothetical protein